MGLAAALLCAPAARAQVNNPSLATAPDQPERIQPDYQERGVSGYAGPAAGSSQSGQTTGLGGGSTTSPGDAGSDTSVEPGEGGQSSAMTAMASTSYGATAVATANQTGVNVEAVASIGKAESQFQNGVVQNPAFLGDTKRAETAGLRGSDFGGKDILCARRRAAPGQARWG